MKKLLIIIICIFIISCDNRKPKHMKGNTVKHSDIRYIKDTRTDICFAEIGNSTTYSFTAVDCEKVEKLIEEK